jgi:hypothetical protein
MDFPGKPGVLFVVLRSGRIQELQTIHASIEEYAMTNEEPTGASADVKESPLMFAYVVLAFTCVALVMFGDLVFQTGDTVISHRLSDGSQYFSRMRDFGFSELAKGNMPLWNPHIFSGTPFVGAFQTGMFYPLNAVYLILPLSNAMNVDVAIHVFLMSFFMCLWARKRGLSWGAGFVAGIILAYGGAGFTRVMAGHITMIQAWTWAPLILLSIDHVIEKRSNGWMLIGVGATTMQILAGYPPCVFMTAMATGFYSCVRLVRAEHRRGIIGRLALYCILPPLMACVQLWTGLATAEESMRSAGVSYEFATTFSFHPEHLLTLLMPAFFGNVIHVMYWGRWAFWDSTIFMGIGGLVLVGCSLFFGPKSSRRFSFTLVFLFVVLALGSYTPVFRWVFEIPGFDNFRSPSKFMFPASLFAAMLAGLGMDAAIQGKVRAKALPVIVGITALLCFLLSAWISTTVTQNEPSEGLRQFIDQREPLDDTIFMSLQQIPLPKIYYIQIAHLASISSLIAGLTCTILCAALWMSKAKSWLIYVIPVVAVLEVLMFARVHRPTFQLSDNDRPTFDGLYESAPGDYRIMDVTGIDNSIRNHAMDAGKYVIWGYDPVILDRYAQFVVFAASGDKRAFEQGLLEAALSGNDPLAESIHKSKNFEFVNKIDGDMTLFRLLRCRYVIINPGEWDAPGSYWNVGGPMPRFYFQNAYSVHKTKDSIFDALKNPAFDPASKVLLESEPVPKPDVLSDGKELTARINVVSETTDSIEFELTVDHNTLLIITDSYSKNWRAIPLENSVQDQYDVMPVDYTLRGIPLASGTHHFVLEYAPTSYTVGRWISFVSVLFFLSCCVAVGFKNYQQANLMSKRKP